MKFKTKYPNFLFSSNNLTAILVSDNIFVLYIFKSSISKRLLSLSNAERCNLE